MNTRPQFPHARAGCRHVDRHLVKIHARCEVWLCPSCGHRFIVVPPPRQPGTEIARDGAGGSSLET